MPCVVCLSKCFESWRKSMWIQGESTTESQQPLDLSEKHSLPSPDGWESIILHKMIWRLKLLIIINMGTISQIDSLDIIRSHHSINYIANKGCWGFFSTSHPQRLYGSKLIFTVIFEISYIFKIIEAII